MLRNTTNIPDRLVAIAAAFAMPPDCPPIACITVKNKRRGKIGGQWGWFYPDDNQVITIIPRRITRTHDFKLRYTKKRIRFSTRAEFLVHIMAHELRHAWQWKHWNTPAMKWRLERTRVGKYAREVDAEIYQMQILRKWQHEIMPLIKEVA